MFKEKTKKSSFQELCHNSAVSFHATIDPKFIESFEFGVVCVSLTFSITETDH